MNSDTTSDSPDPVGGEAIEMPPASVMPGTPSASPIGAGGGGADGTGSADMPAPASFGLQVAQLVVIPAVIVVVCIALAGGFGMLAGASDSIDNHLMKLRQSGGAGRMMGGLQDPRYKDRWLAAYNLATLIPSIESPEEKLRVSGELIVVLNDHVSDDEQVLQAYLLMALGQLGQEGGLETIMARLDAPHPHTRHGAIGGVLSWPDRDQARLALSGLGSQLTDEDPLVAAAAAAAIGELASGDDTALVAPLRELMSSHNLQQQEVRWNAAVALARIGDEVGSRYVIDVLLNRDALAEQLRIGLPDPTTQNPRADQSLRAGQDRVILSTLAAARTMDDPAIWAKIRELADNDPSPSIRKAARGVVGQRG